jgi:AraC-like DNA-binding protein
MKSFIKLDSDNKNTTLLKYFFSYFILLSILFLGFFLAVRFQLGTIYTKDLHQQAKTRLAVVKEDFNDNLSSINQINSFLTSDINLVLSRYKNDEWYRYQASKKITEYNISSNAIDTICYIDFKKNSILSSGNHVKGSDGVYEIYTGKKYITFPLKEYTSATRSQLIFLKSGSTKMLIYLPYNNGIQSYSIFYILNMKEVKNLMKNGITSGITTVCLLNNNNEIITGSATNLLEPHLKHLDGTQGYYTSKNGQTLYAITDLTSNYSIVAVLSNQAIIDQVNIAFRNTYLLLLIVFSVGMLCIIFAMRITYWPLHKLTQKLVPAVRSNQGYVEQLDIAFTDMYSENQQLQEKIDSYRLSMQKSILDSIVTENNESSLDSSINIDQLFRMEMDSHIFIIKVVAPDKKVLIPKEIKQFIDESLPGDNPCSILETSKNYLIFLIHYVGIEQNKEEVLHLLMFDLYEATGFKVAISNSSTSPLEIPSLYENAIAASSYLNQDPVVSYQAIYYLLSEQSSFTYPYSHLELLNNNLREQVFTNAKASVDVLFTLLDKASDSKSSLPDFFTRCVLIDILTIIVNSMNRMNIKFKNYSDMYFSTLYMCRSCSYLDKRDEIYQSVIHLLQTYETEYANSTIHADQIQTLIQDSYSSPDFSISTLADNFQVSIAYMSYLFKKKFNENFSDYLWKLRMEKAEELLRDTNMTIDNISIAIGYLNTSSFRRKFKQETGLTPSQYRQENS